MHSSRALPLCLAFVGLVQGCGGPNLESKAANAIQTLLANSAEAFLLGGGSTPVTFECSGGGSLTYNAPTSIDPGDTNLDLPITFNNCKIKVCSDTITFTSAGTSLLSMIGLDPGQAADLVGGDAIVGDDEQFLEIEIVASAQGVRGFLQGNVDFAYKMRIIGNNRGLKTISIVESERGDPLKVRGQALPATGLSALADRC